MKKNLTWIVHLLACAAFFAAAVWGRPAHAADAGAAYRIARGDELSFRFFHTPELNTQAIVRSDGRVALPLLGEINVEGLSVAELSALVMLGLAPQVKRPEVTINVHGMGSQRVFVGGEVVRAGMQPLLGPLTVLQAVMVAEGLRDTARASVVRVLRRGSGGERQVIAVDLKAAMAGEAHAADVLLQPYDVVMVPKSGIANINQWVDQYLRRNLPIHVGFSYSVNRGEVVR